VFISECGADAKQGFHADALTRFSEEYQADVYRARCRCWKNSRLQRLHAVDFVRLPLAAPPPAGIQDGWNLKGVIGHNGEKKMAFDVLKKPFYAKKRKRTRQNNFEANE
jgi:beta-glucuronidase